MSKPTFAITLNSMFARHSNLDLIEDEDDESEEGDEEILGQSDYSLNGIVVHSKLSGELSDEQIS